LLLLLLLLTILSARQLLEDNELIFQVLLCPGEKTGTLCGY
jgi:hypothetical protein